MEGDKAREPDSAIVMMILLLFLQKQNLASAIYLFGLGTRLYRKGQMLERVGGLHRSKPWARKRDGICEDFPRGGPFQRVSVNKRVCDEAWRDP